MSKRRISATLVTETVLVGAASLALDLVLGVGLSQLMSALVGSLFGADMPAYRLTVSGEAITRTILNFAIMYLVVMLLNARAVTRMRLIDLMQSGRRSEPVKMRNPLLCTVVFVVAALMLAAAYAMVCCGGIASTIGNLAGAIGIGSVGTLLLFWSLSGFFLRVALAMRSRYHTGLNSFMVRQIASKVNTVVFSMATISLMLFFTITMMSSAFALRNGMMDNLASRCPADFEVTSKAMDIDGGDAPRFDDVVEHYARYGYDVTAPLGDYVHMRSYHDGNLSLRGRGGQGIGSDCPLPLGSHSASGQRLGEVVRVSDYNALMGLYGCDRIELGDGEFAIVADYEPAVRVLDGMLRGGASATVFGHELESRYDKVQDGFVGNGAVRGCDGIVVVPDGVADESCAGTDYLIGNYSNDAATDLDATERMVAGQLAAVDRPSEPAAPGDGDFWVRQVTKATERERTIQTGATMTFVCLYLGIVFLVASGAILALRGLSESVDGAPRYETLRKIGADEREIGRSLFRQTGFFFALPLLVACLHAAFGMLAMRPLLAAVGVTHVWGSVAITIAVILAIYGCYFACTYAGSRRIVAGR